MQLMNMREQAETSADCNWDLASYLVNHFIAPFTNLQPLNNIFFIEFDSR
jgi:hypothetical protein